jgi:hypothetical protein
MTDSENNRGQLTPFIKQRMEEFLGRETDVVELQLMPYLAYVMVNDQRLRPNKINQEERTILTKLRKEGYVDGGISGFAMSRDYWDFCQDILWFAYVAYRAAPFEALETANEARAALQKGQDNE